MVGKLALVVLDEVPYTVGTGNKVIISVYKVNQDFESLEGTLRSAFDKSGNPNCSVYIRFTFFIATFTCPKQTNFHLNLYNNPHFRFHKSHINFQTA